MNPRISNLLLKGFLGTLIWLLVLPLVSVPLNATNQDVFQKHLDNLSTAGIEEGIIYIKLSQMHVHKYFDNVSLNKNGIVEFSIESIDSLNKQFNVTNFKPMFGGAKINNAYAYRHRAHQLHLWFALKLPEDTDLKKVLKAYNDLPDISIAEPVYRIKNVDQKNPVSKRNPGRTYFPDRSKQSVSNQGLNQAVSHNRQIPVDSYFSRNIPNADKPLLTIKNDSIEEIEPFVPNDPQLNSQEWHYNAIELSKAWTIEKGNSLVTVSVHDSGILYSHPDLANAMWPEIGPGGLSTKPGNHGTHVAGTVAAVTNNEVGVAGIAGGSGPAGGARLMSVDIFNDETITTYEGYVYAADLGVPISQNSWSYEDPNAFNQADLDGIDYFVTNGGGEILDGGIVFFSAGNEDSNDLWYPGYYENAIAVASTTTNDHKSGFSNFGEWVDISAPGSGVFSTTLSNGYGNLSGTSMACPHVSGVAALVLSYIPGMISAEQLKEILLMSADSIDQVNPNYIGMLGTGRLNAYKALLLAQSYAVLNAENISAVALGENEIMLNWDLNLQEDTVVVAFNSSGQFTRPESTVNAGDEITPGTFILYKGTGQEFSHDTLKMGTRYYYHIWSYDGDRYSLGKTVFADTDCGFFPTPYIQPFAEARIPNCWQSYAVDDGEADQIWEVGRISFGGLNTTDFSELYAYIDSDIFGEGFFQNTDLRSPAFDLSNMDQVTLSFKHYYRHRTGSGASVHYSTDNGENWTLIYEWFASTSNPESFSIDIPEIAGQPNVTFKWNYFGSDSYYWSINNITVSDVNPFLQTNTIGVANSFSLFPNPAKPGQTVTVSIPNDLNEKTFVKIFNAAGQQMFQMQNTVIENNTSIRLPFMQSGIYLISISNNKSSQTLKLIVTP
jgi:subtilisin family serine protease